MTAAEKELRKANVELRTAIRFAAKRIKDLTDCELDPALPILRRVWEETRTAGR